MATEKRLIDANDVKELINGLSELPWEEVDYLVDSLPTVDAVEVVHGRWIGSGYLDFFCSQCGAYQSYLTGRTNYCPNCGAKMDGEKNA